MNPGDRICITREDIELLLGVFREMLVDISLTSTRLEGSVIALQDENGWIGIGADAFYEEMELVRTTFKVIGNNYGHVLESLTTVLAEFEELDTRMALLFPD